MATQGTALAIVETEEENPEIRQQRIENQLKSIVGRLESEARDRVGKKKSIEDRAIADLEQYHGVYDAETLKNLKQGEKSQLYINITRPKTNAMSAKLMDLLFPTDDKNWGINPTPVPTLTDQAKEAARIARESRQQAIEAAKQAEGQQDPAAAQKAKDLAKVADQADEALAILQAALEEGRKRSELMSREIDDQLKESRYQAVMRDVIEDACKIGTGVCKGPVTGDKVRKGWKQQQQIDPATKQPVNGYALEYSAGKQPAMRYVDFWSFFPSMDARNIEESEGVFERHLLNMKGLRKLARLPGFDKAKIRDLLKAKPQHSAPEYMTSLRNITGANDQATGDLYHVWEYSGPLTAEDMKGLALATGDQATLDEMGEVDELTEWNAIVWFCQGELLKFSIYPFDSGECMYSVFNLEKDEASIFGEGIPAIMRDPQRSLAAGWRAMMDNAGLASGPQIVIAKSLVEPADGDYTIRPRKVWLAKEGIPVGNSPFATFNIPMMQVEMANIIALSKQFIDDMTAIPSVSEGDPGSLPKDTPYGTTVLMTNNTNVIYRRIVKNFDDDMTVPNIRRFYDWNMQFSEKEAIKGDYDVDARGSSVLLVRELQAQSLFAIALQLGSHPKYGAMLKDRNLLKKLFQSLLVPADEVLLTDEEIDAQLAKGTAESQAQMAAAQAQQAEADAKMAVIEKDIAIANMEAQTRLEVETIRRETALMELAGKMNMKLDELDSRLAAIREQTSSKERISAAEAVMTAQVGPGGGGYL